MESPGLSLGSHRWRASRPLQKTVYIFPHELKFMCMAPPPSHRPPAYYMSLTLEVYNTQQIASDLVWYRR